MDREDPTRSGRNADDADLTLSVGEKIGPYTFPIAAGETLPNLPATGIDFPRDPNPDPPKLGSVSPGPGLTTYAFSKNDIQRNLFRIPLH
jgi:hypothetical protein